MVSKSKILILQKLTTYQMLARRYIRLVIIGRGFYSYRPLGTRVLMRLKCSQNSHERESRMPVCFPDRARITEGKGQALTLSELEREGAIHVQAKKSRGVSCTCKYVHVHTVGSHLNLRTIPKSKFPTPNC